MAVCKASIQQKKPYFNTISCTLDIYNSEKQLVTYYWVSNKCHCYFYNYANVILEIVSDELLDFCKGRLGHITFIIIVL